MGEAQGKAINTERNENNTELDRISIGEVESIRQNRCQSRIPLHNGATREGFEAASHFTARAHQNRVTVKSHQE